MMFSYMTLGDETEVTHSQLVEKDNTQTVEVHFERPTTCGFDSARCVLPQYAWITRDGFSEEDIAFFERFLRSNAHLLFRFARNGGISCA